MTPLESTDNHRQISKLPRLSPEAVADLGAGWTVIDVATGESLVLSPGDIGIVQRGVFVRFARCNELFIRGTRVDIVTDGQGFSADTDGRIDAVCESGTVQIFPASALETRKYAVALELLRHALARLEAFAALQHLTTAPQRVLGLLDLLADGEGQCPPIPWHHIAGVLVMRAETLSRAVRELEERGELRRTRRGAVLLRRAA